MAACKKRAFILQPHIVSVPLNIASTEPSFDIMWITIDLGILAIGFAPPHSSIIQSRSDFGCVNIDITAIEIASVSPCIGIL
jgi:hypothetical protein